MKKEAEKNAETPYHNPNLLMTGVIVILGGVLIYVIITWLG